MKEESTPEVGTKAPEFALYDSDKNQRTLNDFVGTGSGKKTVLAFFPGAFTSTCTKELCTFRDMFPELESLNGQLVAISVDAPFAQKAFAEKYNLNFPLLCDFGREVTRRYGIIWKDLSGVKGYEASNRAIFIVDEGGRIVYKWIAPNPGVLPDFREIKSRLGG